MDAGKSSLFGSKTAFAVEFKDFLLSLSNYLREFRRTPIIGDDVCMSIDGFPTPSGSQLMDRRLNEI